MLQGSDDIICSWYVWGPNHGEAVYNQWGEEKFSKFHSSHLLKLN